MDIKGDWKKRAVSGLMVLAMALSLLPTSILAADTRSVTDNAIKNGSFEQPEFNNMNAPQWAANLVPDWHTTASDQKIEFGSTRKDGTVPHIVGNPNLQDSGCQFAELNADEESTLYQYAETVGGNVYEWGLSHRGREGDDQMALIIGPKQDVDPDKPSKSGRDQFMRMTDWVRQHASEMGVTVYGTGCTQKITVYSKKFDENGEFQNDIGDAFSASPSKVYTEKWNVWIIGTNNNAWGNYGTKSSDYAEGKLAYSCRYAVPDGQTKTVFAFCSYSSATSNKTLGNLIDNIHFRLYQTITAAATAGGSGYIIVPTGDVSEYYPIGSSMSELVVANGSPITVKVVKPESDDVQFVGAYVTRQTQNGLEKEFIPAASWKPDDGTYTYTYEHRVEEPADIVLVFVKKPMVIYEANGGQKYVHTAGAPEPTDTVSFAENTGLTEYTSHAAQAPAGCEDTWQFAGWLLARNKVLLPAEHTVTYNEGTNTLTFNGKGTNISTGEAVSSTTVTDGATLVAQWKWRQRFVTASRVKENGTVSDSIQENTACGSITVTSDGSTAATEKTGAVTDYYSQANEKITATATANAGYCFVGWYQQVDGKYELVSNQATYTYITKAKGVQTVYAHFAPTHTVTYRWTTEEGKCPLKAPEPPAAGTVIDGGSYLIDQTYTKDYAIDGTATINGRTVPGKWVFTGWCDENKNIREMELINVTGNRTLTGYWTFEPEAEHSLSYQFADSGSWSPSGTLGTDAVGGSYFRNEEITAANVPDHKNGELTAANGVTLEGSWEFNDWKRSDMDKTVKAADQFAMPDNDLTLTGQWTFTPKTYTVVYNTGNGRLFQDPNNEKYDYSALLGANKPGLAAPSTGIPFGATITLQALPDDVQVPDETYFAGWSLTDPNAAGAQADNIKVQQPGGSVGYRKLQVTRDKEIVTVYAVYKKTDIATVTFSVNDSNWGFVDVSSGSFTVAGNTVSGADIRSTATARAGYHFVGWREEGGETTSKSSASLTVTTAMMKNKLQVGTPLRVYYVAVFAPNSFTIKYDANCSAGEATGTMDDQTFTGQETQKNLAVNQFKRSGYAFTGWATKSDGTEDTYSDGAAFTKPVENGASITLYAQWKKLTDVTIFYTPEPTSLGTVKLNGAATEENDITVQEGTVYEKLNPETGEVLGATAVPGEGSVFVGWYDAQDTGRNTPLATKLIYTPGKDQTSGRYQDGSYVALIRQKQYVLHYDANGGTGTMENQTFSHGDAQPLTECAFARDGYSFVGWAKDAAAQQAVYSDQASLFFEKAFPEGTKEATLYAVWKENTVTLSYVSADETLGTVSLASEDILAASGEKARGSTAQPKSGCTFDGWYSENGTLLSRELTYVPVKDGSVWHSSTYTARFSRIPVTPAKPTEPKQDTVTLAPIPQILNGDDHYAYLVGYEDGTVRPNGSISRAEVATVLFRLLKDDVRMQNLTKDNAYSDVSDTAWYAAAVSTLSKMGVISGYPDGTFRPNAPITRAEFAAMIARFDETAKSADTPFTDISGHWAENAIGKAYGNGWVEGSSKTVFCPESNLTRAETATLLNRVLHRLPEKESDLLANQIVWPDNPETFWGYLAIQEATNSHEYERKADGVHETQTAKRENRDWSKEFEQ